MTEYTPFKYEPFVKGVVGMLYVEWTLQTLTPLLIRANMDAAIKQNEKDFKKGRGTSVALEWVNAKEKLPKNDKSAKEYSHLTDFNYHFTVSGGKVKPDYDIPASSIRGTLRGAAIKSLVEMMHRHAFTIRKKDDDRVSFVEMAEQMESAHKILAENRDHWRDILSLFGSSLDLVPGETHPLTWAGRLRINVKITDTDGNDSRTIDCLGNNVSSTPGNINGHISVKNPLDHVSMATKDGGLHQALEMSEGQKFAIEMHIQNPCRSDIQLINLWHDNINDGFIRFGGLTSQGRGKATIIGKNYKLFAFPDNDLYAKIIKIGKPDLTKGSSLEGIWSGMDCSIEELVEACQ